MKKKHSCNKNHYCESCLHVLGEKQKIIEFCDISNITEEIELYCELCGQKLNSQLDSNINNKTQLSLFKSAIKNSNLKVVCFTAPSIRASVSEVFLDGKIEECQGKLNTALRLLGVDIVFDMNVAADFTVVEEAEEFVKRFKTKKNLPMMTSCCPGWVNFVTKTYPEFIKNLSTCKSPQQMFGALISKYYAESIGKKSTDLFVVSIVPCLVKKLEAKQDGINFNVGYDVDAAITTSELIEMIKEAGIDFKSLEKTNFDEFFGSSSGAGTIFGSTGGVMEAVLRTIGDKVEEKELHDCMYELVRGQEGIRKTIINTGKELIKIAVVSGLMNIKPLLESIKQGEQFDFIEVMACPGGCVGGGGQPRVKIEEQTEITQQRANVLYKDAELKKHKKAHKNPSVIKIYDKHIGKVGGKTAYKILHRKFK